MPGATVSVLNVPDELTAVTDHNGRYTIRNVPEGSYQVQATGPGISRSEPATATVRGRRASARTDLALPRPAATELVSQTTQGNQGNSDAWWPKVSDDGQVVVFASPASNLVPGDTNGTLDIFVTDRTTHLTRRVSVASDGTEANDFSLTPTVSADGRYVGFSSGASNLVHGDTNQQTDAYVHDLETGTTERVSVASDGTAADGLSSAPSLSSDGRYAVFSSDATNLVPGDTNNASDVFLHDRQTGTTVRISQTPQGGPGNGSSRDQSISRDGRFIVFDSMAGNLAAGDTDDTGDVFVYDRQTGTTKLVGGDKDGENTTGQISGDGKVVGYSNSGRLFVDVLNTGRTEQVDVTSGGEAADNWSFAPSLSSDGSKVAFYSTAATLAPGDAYGTYDVFVRDRTAGTTTRVSGGPEGVNGDGASDLPSISGNGRYVAFESTSANLVAEDVNKHYDVFVHDLVSGPEARFALSDLSVTPSTARPDARIQVTARIKNVGEKAGTYQAVLLVAGEPEQQRAVTVRTDRDTRVRFTVRRSATGTYAVRIGPLTGQVTVRR